jgi:hypothetical protein
MKFHFSKTTGVLEMNNRQPFLAVTAAIALLTVGASAAASGNGEVKFDREVESCISEVIDQANLDDAIRVRHLIVNVKNSTSGYVFKINTSIFVEADDKAIREYASYCVAKGDDKPVKFRIDKVSG